ncbi:MAG TPA: DUF433 domain-containing protein [Blastocatellia bacterium]|nr:DUF433 domain-containing protein [Blastocatellia bacterium]
MRAVKNLTGRPGRQGKGVPPITRHPERLGGTPTIAGTRLPVTTLIDYLNDGYTVDEFVAEFETVSRAEVEAVLTRIREALNEGWLAEDVAD